MTGAAHPAPPVGDHRPGPHLDDAPGTLAAFRALVDEGRLDQPGAGRTSARFAALAAGSRSSLSAGRLFEAHADGQSILLEAGRREPEALGLLGVWASERRADPVHLVKTPGGWVVRGTKPFCSGAPLVDHALVTALDGDEPRLAVVERLDHRVVVGPSTWVGHGMRATLTRSVAFDDVPVVDLVGDPGWYLARPGFWHGAVGVAASWFGGAQRVLDTLRDGVGEDDGHLLAHLGEAEAEAFAMEASLERAAGQIDDDPDDRRAAHRRALAVRGVVARGCVAILEHAAALGPRAMAFDGDHAQRIADLDVYVRQDHGRHDAEQLGRLVRAEGATGC